MLFDLVTAVVTVVTASVVKYCSKHNLNSYLVRNTGEATGASVYSVTKQTD